MVKIKIHLNDFFAENPSALILYASAGRLSFFASETGMLKKDFPQTRHGDAATFISLRHEMRNPGYDTSVPRYPICHECRISL